MVKYAHKSALLALLALATIQASSALNCYTCDSTDPKCITDLSTLSKACPEGATKCFSKVDNGLVSRGCLAADDTTTCADANTCKSCENGDLCNNQVVCKVCESSTDANCLLADAAATTFNKLCDTQCLVNIKEDKTLERRCAVAADTTTTCTGSTCNLCNSGNCNSGVFPSNRRRCYQCATGDAGCADVAAAGTAYASSVCPLYDAADQCYMFSTAVNTMERGCTSSTNKTCTDTTCKQCNSDSCNNVAYERSQALKCITCNSSTTGSSGCLWGQSPASAAQCQTKLKYNEDDMCYTQVKDNVVYRGCYYDRTTELGECTAAANCNTCTTGAGDGCNAKEANAFTCIVCRSDSEPKCWNDATDLKPGKACRNIVTEANSGCFNGIWNDIAIRGCLVDADARMLAVCNDANNKQCTSCKDIDCNTGKSSAMLAATVATTLLLATTLLHVVAAAF